MGEVGKTQWVALSAESRVHDRPLRFFYLPETRGSVSHGASVCLRLVRDLHLDYKTHITTAEVKKKKQAMSCQKRVCVQRGLKEIICM